MQLFNFIPPFLGLSVGLLMGLTGSGGGILSVPLLLFGLNLSMSQATPLALCSMAVSAGIGAFLGLKAKILRYKAAALMSFTGLLLSPLGLWLARLTPEKPLVAVFGFLLLFISIRMLLQSYNTLKTNLPYPRSVALCEVDGTTGKFIWNRKCLSALILAGGATGFLSGLLGVGGGFILVPALRRFTNLSMQSIVATTLGVIAIVSTWSALLATATNNIDLSLALEFICGSAIGLVIGRQLIEKIDSNRVQLVFAIFSFIIAIELIYKNII